MYWLSESFQTLFERSQQPKTPHSPGRETFADIVVVGSGYGGAVAAQKLAEYLKTRHESPKKSERIIVLERGQEFLPGEFPENIAELPSQIRINGNRTGSQLGYPNSLFQLFPSDSANDSSVSVLVANALGGGSQINANVSKRPLSAIFKDPRWPKEFKGAQSARLNPYFDAALIGLAAKPLPETHAPKKLKALERLHTQLLQPDALPEGYDAVIERPAITVNFVRFENGLNENGIEQPECISCGNCCTGCNTGAKNTLTTNYLPKAKRDGAELYTEALVDQIHWDETSKRFRIEVRSTQSVDAQDHLRPLSIEAKIVILAGGAIGSSEILLRSNGLHSRLSRSLGKNFSTNGDSISARYNTHVAVQGLGLGLAAINTAPDERPGPTITGAIQIIPRAHSEGRDGLAPASFTIEDCAIPLAISELGSELLTTSAMFRKMTEGFSSASQGEGVDPLANDPAAIARSEFYLAMTRDSASGKVVLTGAAHKGSVAHAKIQWTNERPPPFEAPQHSREQALLDQILAHPQQLGGVYLPNPLREPVPKAIGSMMRGTPGGSAVTVHPLGGCPMADDVDQGVVDFRGRVFDRSNRRVIPGLYVMDGSILPCSLETNPLLTICALAGHAVDKLIELDLEHLLTQHENKTELGSPAQLIGPEAGNQTKLPPRPTIIRPKEATSIPSFEFKERLRTKLSDLQGLNTVFSIESIRSEDIQAGLIYLELQLGYRPSDLKKFLTSADHLCALNGHLRIIKRKLTFPAFADEDWEQLGDSVAIESGTIQLFVQTSKPSLRNALRAGLIYRDRRFKREQGLEARSSLAGSNFASVLSFLGHVGATREVRYDFLVRSKSGSVVRGQGCKPIRYRRDSNVWKDLFTLPLCLQQGDKTTWEGKLLVDVDYFLTEGVPVVSHQNNLPESLLKVASYGLFYLRVILSTYFYEFGPPDYPKAALEADPLSGALQVAGLSFEPKHYWLPVREFGRTLTQEPKPGESYRDLGRKFEKRLHTLQAKSEPPSDPSYNLISVYQTRAVRPRGSVLLLHGYAISSSMWSSPRIGKNMVQSLLEADYDVYVADLRTSSSLSDLINHAISFDAVAAEDIPCLIEYVWQQNSVRQAANLTAASSGIHVIAHCMGSAQFSMALLAQAQAGKFDGSWSSGKARFELSRKRVAKACFFQVAPLLAVTRANAVRGRVAGVLDALVRQQQLGPWLKEDRSVKPMESLLDRLAMSFPYPEGFDTGEPEAREASPWVGVTRKAFWLYGQTWDNANLNDDVKRNIHEIIGPVNLATYRQVGAFARSGRVVNKEGINDFVKDTYLEEVFGSFESLWLHGERSGMFEKQTTQGTSAYLKDLLQPKGLQGLIQFQSLPGFGHLDSLIGEYAHLHAHRHVIDFLAAPQAPSKLDDYSGNSQLRPSSIGPAFEALLPLRSIKPSSCGPFFSRTQDGLIRLWFFIEERLSDQLSHACVGLVTASKNREDQFSGQLHKAWRVSSTDQLAGLHQFVCEFSEQELAVDMSVVVGGIFESVNSPKVGFQSDVDFTLLRENLELLIALGSFVAPNGRQPSELEFSRPRGTQRSFMVASCRYPGWLIDRSHSKQAHQHWQTLAEHCTTRPEALVLTGDQVYLDAFGNAIADAPRSDSLASIYVDAFGGRTSDSSAWSMILKRLSLHCQMDDHEFTDNYTQSGGLSQATRDLALHAFTLFQGPSLPAYPNLRALGQASNESREARRANQNLSGETLLCGHDAFMLDTRSHRSRKLDRLYADQDFQAFKQWAAQVDKTKAKFLFTGSVLFPVLRATLAQPASGFDEDTLSAYPTQRNRLLEVIAAEKLSNVVFVSGDLHLSCSGRGFIQSANDSLPFGFCVSSGLYAPLPFANTRTWQLPSKGVSHRIAFDLGLFWAIDFKIDQIVEQQSIAQIVIKHDAHDDQTFCHFVDAHGQAGMGHLLAQEPINKST